MATRNGMHHHQKGNGKVATVATAGQEVALVEVAAPPAPVPATTAAAPVLEPDPAVVAPVPAPATAAVVPAPVPGPAATEEPPPPEEPVKPPITHSRQSEKMRRFLAATDDRLTGVEMVGEPLSSLLVAHRITPQCLAGLRGLYAGAQAAMNGRDDAILAEAQTIIDMQRALRQMTVVFGAFRHVGRILFPDPVTDRTAQLAFYLDDGIPESINLMIDRAHSVLAAARQEPQASRLAPAGYDSERLDEIEALVDALDLLYKARRQARQVAIDMTAVRNATVAELRTAMHQLRVEVAAILRAHPEVNAPADFY